MSNTISKRCIHITLLVIFTYEQSLSHILKLKESFYNYSFVSSDKHFRFTSESTFQNADDNVTIFGSKVEI